jgi:hypothetical protein
LAEGAASGGENERDEGKSRETDAAAHEESNPPSRENCARCHHKQRLLSNPNTFF